MKKSIATVVVLVCAAVAFALGSASFALGSDGHKDMICHVPPGNPANAHVIVVDHNSVKEIAHLKHGDWIVDESNPCPPSFD